MGEAVASSEELGLSVMETERKKDGTVKWERFLPRMALRVLLVEADDSTRHLISVLLRKCSYKVASVADGLKAWEILKARPHEIDLILTEVDLPAISGFALLSLIMEHETCKNIPVIMMSSHDSVSTVYSCMLRGAADYLVKPIRRNELRNLWQHVWRRQSTTVGGNQPQSESEAQHKVEGTSENKAACNDSSSYTGSAQRNNEHTGKGSDAQSSCTRPEAESAHEENVQNFAQPIEDKSSSGGKKLFNNEILLNIDQKLIEHCCEPGGSVRDSCKDANTATTSKNIESESQRKDANLASEANDNKYALVNSSKEAIDLIGAFNNYQNCSYKNSSSAVKFDYSPQLDLSLKRSHPSCFEFESQVTESHTIKHSNASAFTRYTNRPLKCLHPTPTSDGAQQNEYGADTYSTMISTQKSTLSLATNLSEQSDVPLSDYQQRVYPVPVTVSEIKFSHICTGYGPVHPSMFCTPTVPSPTPSPSLASHQEPTFRGSLFHQSNVENSHSQQLCDQLGQNTSNSTNQNKHKLGHEHESLEECRHFPPATGLSASSSFRNSSASHLNSIGYGSICVSNSNVDHAAPKIAAQSKNEEGLSAHGGNSHRSLRREAALTKFRLKRKERCFEKKVRYESRKKLAEQRPRVKGQFVRHLQSDNTPAESENHRENSTDG